MGTSLLQVFVYGSLKRGGHNHGVLKGAQFLGDWVTESRFHLYDLGHFPAVCLEGEMAISGEVYAISPEHLSQLDRLEGYPDWYQRMAISTQHGDAWIYYLPQAPENAVCAGTGHWQLPVLSG